MPSDIQTRWRTVSRLETKRISKKNMSSLGNYNMKFLFWWLEWRNVLQKKKNGHTTKNHHSSRRVNLFKKKKKTEYTKQITKEPTYMQGNKVNKIEQELKINLISPVRWRKELHGWNKEKKGGSNIRKGYYKNKLVILEER